MWGKGYTCPVNRFVPAHVPTDFGRIIDLGIYKFYDETNNEKIIDKLKDAVLKLLNGDAIQVWIGYKIWCSITYEEQSESPPFFAANNLTEFVKSALLNNKELLIS